MVRTKNFFHQIPLQTVNQTKFLALKTCDAYWGKEVTSSFTVFVLERTYRSRVIPRNILPSGSMHWDALITHNVSIVIVNFTFPEQNKRTSMGSCTMWKGTLLLKNQNQFDTSFLFENKKNIIRLFILLVLGFLSGKSNKNLFFFNMWWDQRKSSIKYYLRKQNIKKIALYTFKLDTMGNWFRGLQESPMQHKRWALITVKWQDDNTLTRSYMLMWILHCHNYSKHVRPFRNVPVCIGYAKANAFVHWA